MRAISAVLAVLVLLLAPLAASGQQASPSLLKSTFSKFPIYFIENRGVYPDEVAYYIQGADKTLFFTPDGITFRLKGKERDWVVKLAFVGANPHVVPRGEHRQQAVFSYFHGPEKDWKTGLRTFSKVVYEDLWSGIDLVYKGAVNQLKYEFVVRPGADTAKIRLRYRGATALRVTEAGALRVETPKRGFEDAPPLAWQEVDGKRVPVEIAYRLDPRPAIGGVEFGFAIGEYDPTRPLVLDPAVLVYCGYIGGSQYDWPNRIAVDAAGNAYVAGGTNSNSAANFPVKVGPDPTYNGGNGPYGGDAFVAKVDATGARLLYCGYIGGAGLEWALDIEVDSFGNAYVVGTTTSHDRTFPVKVGPDVSYNGGGSLFGDGFVAEVNAAGTGLVYCGYIGGSADDEGIDIAVDRAGHAYVTGRTRSDENSFPVAVGPDLTYNGGPWDAYVAKVNAAGSGLDYCGYLGGAGTDWGKGAVVDASGHAYFSGWTDSNQKTFPVKVGPDLTHNGGADAYVAKIRPIPSAQNPADNFFYCGYIGGSASECASTLAVDPAGCVYAAGGTQSDANTFPVKVGPDLTHNGRYDAFVAKVDAQGSALLYCGYIGGAGDDNGENIRVDSAGHAYVTGPTSSDHNSFPVQAGPDSIYNGGGDGYVAKIRPVPRAGNPKDNFVYCGYLGGTSNDTGQGIAVDAAGNAYLAGITHSPDSGFPVRVGPDRTYNGGGDAFVAKVALTLLGASGTTRPGGQLDLQLAASDSAGLPYQVGTSLGTGPIPVGSRKLGLSADDLLVVTVNNYWPTIFSGYRGLIDSQGQAKATIHIPNIPALIGVRLHSAFVTSDRSAPWGIRSISNTFSFSITK